MATARRRFRLLLALLGVIAGVTALGACQSDEQKLDRFMQRADEYRESGQLAEAIIEYRNALQIAPNHAAAHEGLAESYLKSKKFREGYWELSETVRLDPDNVDARISYATLALAAKLNDDVLEQAEAIVALDPENARGYLLLGQAYANLDRLDEVAAPLERAVALEPDDGSYRAVMAAFYLSRNRLDDAEVQLREGIARDPQPLLYTLLGQLTLSAKRFDEAEEAFSGAIGAAEKQALEAGDGPEPAELAQAYQNLAGFYFQRGEAEKAVATLKQGIQKSENRGDLVSLLTKYYRSTGDTEAADELIQSVAELDPTDPLPFLTISSTRGQAGDLEGALEAAERAIAADPKHVQARLRKAELLIDIGIRSEDQAKVDEGRALVDQVLAEDATSPEGLFVLAKFEIASENLDAGIEALRAALDSRPNWAQAHFVLGSALLLKGEKQRARAELARAVELRPGLVDARRLLVKVHADLGEYEYAIENGRRYLEARPDDDRTRIIVAQSLVRLGKVDEAVEMLEPIPQERRGVDVLFAVGRLQAVRGESAAARKTLLEANEKSPNNAMILKVLVELDREDGQLSYSIKRVNDAVAAKPDDAELWELKGLVAMLAGQLEDAEQALQKAIELDPNNLSSYQYLARIYAGTGRTQQTIALYEEAIASTPENAGAHHFLGVLYEMTGKTANAREQYELALQYDSSLGESKNNLAYLMAESGEDLDRALKLAQEAKASMPDSANAADTLGWVLYKRGVASAAVGYLREAIQVSDPDDPTVGQIRVHLSLAYEATGDLDKAKATLESALGDLDRLKQSGKLSGDPPWAAEARSNIERLESSG